MTYGVDRDTFVAKLVGDHDRASGYAIGGKYRYLSLVDDRGGCVCTKSSVIGDGEGTGADVIQTEAPVSCT